MKNFIGSRLKSFSARQADNSEKECRRSLTCKQSVNEEYKEAFRTNSYLEIRTKAEDHSDACDVCESLLQCIQQIKINDMKLKRVIKIGKRVCNGAKTPDLCALIFQELSRYALLKNPLYCIIDKAQFPRVHDANSDLLARLTSKRRRIRRKIWFFTFCKNLGGCSLVDIAAKATFIMMNDLDTLSRLAGRLFDEIEHRKTVAAMCAKSGKIEVLKEALRVFNGHQERFSELLQELEEHLYLCFHTINRSRRLVLTQITGPNS
ncbi:UPF0496 protein [Raphanus sativus]|nr:UPF0496 protein [Raphanus sativus]